MWLSEWFHFISLCANIKYLAGEENNDCDAYKELYKHVQKGDWEATNEFLKGRPNVISEKITDMEKTLLHIAVFAGHEHIVKGLVEKMSDDDLERTDKFGYTALAERWKPADGKMHA
jgi:ankyrin repeat protein